MSDVRLILGNCLDVWPDLFPFDAIITDPPYGISLDNHGNFSRPWTIRGDLDQAVTEAVISRAACGQRCLCMFGSAYLPLRGGWRNILVWDKGPAVGAGGDPATCWKRTFDLIFINDNRPLLGKRDSAVLKFWQSPNFRKDHKNHPAEKPVPLMRYLISQLVPEGGIVCDPFMGSGTTGVACLQTGRKFIGVEIDPAYYAIAEKRIKAEQERFPLFDKAPEQADLFV